MMRAVKQVVMRRALFLAVAVLLVSGRAQATVYSWREGDGSYHFTNQAADVPPGQLDAFRTVTEAHPVSSTADSAAADPPAARADDPPSGYEQGLEAGLRIAEEQIRLSGELAERMQPEPAAAPPVYMPAPPQPIVVNVAPSDTGCGPWGCGYGYGYPYNSWVVGPAVFGRPFFGHGRFHGEHRFDKRPFFTGGFNLGTFNSSFPATFNAGFPGGFSPGFGGGRGMHGGGGFGGRR